MSSALAGETESARPTIAKRRTPGFFMDTTSARKESEIETGKILREVGQRGANRILRHLFAPEERAVGVVHGTGGSRGLRGGVGDRGFVQRAAGERGLGRRDADRRGGHAAE